MDTEKEIAGTIILITEAEGFFNEEINQFIFNNRFLFNIGKYIFEDDSNINSLVKKVVAEIESEGFVCKVDVKNNLIVKAIQS